MGWAKREVRWRGLLSRCDQTENSQGWRGTFGLAIAVAIRTPGGWGNMTVKSWYLSPFCARTIEEKLPRGDDFQEEVATSGDLPEGGREQRSTPASPPALDQTQVEDRVQGSSEEVVFKTRPPGHRAENEGRQQKITSIARAYHTEGFTSPWGSKPVGSPASGYHRPLSASLVGLCP